MSFHNILLDMCLSWTLITSNNSYIVVQKKKGFALSILVAQIIENKYSVWWIQCVLTLWIPICYLFQKLWKGVDRNLWPNSLVQTDSGCLWLAISNICAGRAYNLLEFLKEIKPWIKMHELNVLRNIFVKTLILFPRIPKIPLGMA